MSVFSNKDLFPTEHDVVDRMGIECEGKVVLEPQAGFGHIVDWLWSHNAKKVFTCEKEPSLIQNLQATSTFLGNDFLELTEKDVSHIEMIVMNPPFSNGSKHILHAWEIAPEGCQIITLCNYETIVKVNRYRELNSVIRDYGTSENLGDCFSDSERSTNVDIGLITLNKPVLVGGIDFSDFFMDDEEIEEVQGNGIVKRNEIRVIISRYVDAVKKFEQLDKIKKDLDMITAPLGTSNIQISVGYSHHNDNRVGDTKEFSILLQKKSWSHIFDKVNISKYVTTGVMKDVNKMIENQQRIPFTERNVYKMLDVIYQTREQTFNRSLEEAVDSFTKHTDENRYNVEGWKTNSGHMLNRKFICNYIFEVKSSNKVDVKYAYRTDQFSDLYKVMCAMNGVPYEWKNELRPWQVNNHKGGIETNTWYDWGFFEIKGFKKGTIHVKFKDEKVWHRLNAQYAKLKGFTLPEK